MPLNTGQESRWFGAPWFSEPHDQLPNYQNAILKAQEEYHNTHLGGAYYDELSYTQVYKIITRIRLWVRRAMRRLARRAAHTVRLAQVAHLGSMGKKYIPILGVDLT